MQGLIRIAGGTSVILLSSLVTLSRGVASDYPLLRGRTRAFRDRAFREHEGHRRSPPSSFQARLFYFLKDRRDCCCGYQSSVGVLP